MTRASTVPLDKLQRLAEGGTVYALLDACDEPRIPAYCRALPAARAACLFEGQGLRDFWHVAPYLIQTSAADVDWIRRNLWNTPWGYFVLARTELMTLRAHYRTYLRFQRQDGTVMLFRFYDPRVIKALLAGWARDQVQQFYGPAKGFALTEPFQLESVELLAFEAPTP
jgi:hypothetical protein